jgi:hypothetical protein
LAESDTRDIEVPSASCAAPPKVDWERRRIAANG